MRWAGVGIGLGLWGSFLGGGLWGLGGWSRMVVQYVVDFGAGRARFLTDPLSFLLMSSPHPLY